MPRQRRRTIQVISHGPSCLDGVMAAAAIRRFYPDDRVLMTLAANGDSDRIIQSVRPRADGGAEEVWITDLSWTQAETAGHLTGVIKGGARAYWIDHHRTAVGRADAPEFEVPFTERVLSEEFSAALLTYKFLAAKAEREGDFQHLSAYQKFAPFAAIADDHDRWIHRIPESADWALAVQTLGGIESYREIIRLSEPVMSRRLKLALEAGLKAMDKSFGIAKATMVERELANGLRVRSACCMGYSSEVASRLYEGQHRTVVALFDLRSLGVSLRRSADCDVDLSELARSFGGGGHAAAAGFAVDEIKLAPAERLAEVLGARLTHN
ncbi:MAG TPA: DHHA1 domain-containing protein [Candidatus Binataceae bacterium]|nr:DHHA1 domain-containing protein [Candidatus Binataceae bacterium]